MTSRLITIFILSLSVVNYTAQVIPGPELTCVSVGGANTSITWIAPSPADIAANPGIIPTRYIVYRAWDFQGDFVEIGNYNYDAAIVEYPPHIDTGASADQGSRFYYVALEYFSNPLIEVPSETVSSIHMEMINNNSSVQLDWTTLVITEGANIILQKKLPTTPWQDYFVGNDSFNTFSEAINDCHGNNSNITIGYRVKVEHDSGCNAFSNVEFGPFVDLNPPDPPVVETITVDCLTGNVVIYWTPSLEADAGGYIVQTSQDNDLPISAAETFDGSQDSIVVGPLNLAGDPNPSPNQDLDVVYGVFAFDDCIHANVTLPYGNIGSFPLTAGITPLPRTIYMEAGYDVCTRSVQLNWTAYDSWLLGVDKYIIEGSTDNGITWEQIDFVQGNVKEYLVENVQEEVEYCFLVKAVPNDEDIVNDSYSNKQCLTTSYPEIATSYSIENVTVVSDSQTEVTFAIDTDVEGARYRLEKLGEFGDEYESLGTYPQTVIAGGSLSVTDFGVNNDNRGDVYRLVAIDSCLNEVGMTEISNSIHLEVYADDGEIDNILSWNEYIKWNTGVQEYQVFFSNTEQMPSQPKFVLGPQVTFKMDGVDEFLQSESDFCYRIDAKENGSDKISQSNIKCITQTPLFYLPNAMVLNGQNRIWKPEGGFIEFETYEMAIYNRWGTLLFETKNFFEGWDGTYRGEQVREGVYAYFIKYREGGGKEKFRSGALTVLQAF